MPTNQLNLEETYYQKQPIEIPPPPSDETLNKPLGEVFGASLINLDKVYHGVETSIKILKKDILFKKK